MILDAQLQLANALALTGATSTAANPLLGATYLDAVKAIDWGMGSSIIWYTRINTVFAAASTGGTVQLVLVGGSTAAKVTTSGTPDAIIAVAPASAILQANYATQGAANVEFKIKIPRGFSYEFIGVGAIITTNALTTGKIDSWLLNDGVTDIVNYAAGYTVK